MKSKKQLNASKMRLILSSLLVLILIGMGAGFYFAYTILQTKAEEVAKIQTEAKSSDDQLRRLVELQKQLELNQPTIEKANQIVAESQSYQYQNQIIQDLSKYASQAGVSIMSFTFQDPLSGSTNKAPGSTAIPSSTVSGLKSTSVSIQLNKDLNYTNLLHFIHLIEQNLTRMQVSELLLTKGESRGTVGAQTLNIEVYIK